MTVYKGNLKLIVMYVDLDIFTLCLTHFYMLNAPFGKKKSSTIYIHVIILRKQFLFKPVNVSTLVQMYTKYSVT